MWPSSTRASWQLEWKLMLNLGIGLGWLGSALMESAGQDAENVQARDPRAL